MKNLRVMNGNNPKILITGGLGNVGLWITEFFCTNNFSVSVLSKRTISPLKGLIEIIQCDISDLSDCEKKLKGKSFDYIIHLASYNEGFLPKYHINAISINTLGTRNLLEVIDKIHLKNFIYFSTIHVYDNNYSIIDENTPISPSNDYANTHYFAECYVKQFYKTQNLPYTILRLSNSYGAPKDPNTSKWYLLFNDIVKMAFEKKEIVLKTNGNPMRDFIWLGDVCEILWGITQLELAPNDIYNLSSGKSYKAIEIAKFVQLAYSNIFKKQIDIKVNTNDTTLYNTNYIIKSDKLKKLVSFDLHEQYTEEAEMIFNNLINN